MLHADFHAMVAPGRAGAAPFLAEKLVDQRLVIAPLRRQAVDDDLKAFISLTRLDLADTGPGDFFGNTHTAHKTASGQYVKIG